MTDLHLKMLSSGWSEMGKTNILARVQCTYARGPWPRLGRDLVRLAWLGPYLGAVALGKYRWPNMTGGQFPRAGIGRRKNTRHFGVPVNYIWGLHRHSTSHCSPL